jgi:hypothetical protein
MGLDATIINIGTGRLSLNTTTFVKAECKYCVNLSEHTGECYSCGIYHEQGEFGHWVPIKRKEIVDIQWDYGDDCEYYRRYEEMD